MTIDFQRTFVNHDILSSTMLLHDNDLITFGFKPTSSVFHRCLWTIINHRHDTSMLIIIGNNLHDIDENLMDGIEWNYWWMIGTLYRDTFWTNWWMRWWKMLWRFISLGKDNNSWLRWREKYLFQWRNSWLCLMFCFNCCR